MENGCQGLRSPWKEPVTLLQLGGELGDRRTKESVLQWGCWLKFEGFQWVKGDGEASWGFTKHGKRGGRGAWWHLLHI